MSDSRRDISTERYAARCRAVWRIAHAAKLKGTLLPSYDALATALGCSRGTVQRVLADLKSSGAVILQKILVEFLGKRMPNGSPIRRPRMRVDYVAPLEVKAE